MQNSARRYGPTVLAYCFVAVANALTEWLSFFVAARFVAPFAVAFAAYFIAIWAAPERLRRSGAERRIDRRFTGGAPER